MESTAIAIAVTNDWMIMKSVRALSSLSAIERMRFSNGLISRMKRNEMMAVAVTDEKAVRLPFSALAKEAANTISIVPNADPVISAIACSTGVSIAASTLDIALRENESTERMPEKNESNMLWRFGSAIFCAGCSSVIEISMIAMASTRLTDSLLLLFFEKRSGIVITPRTEDAGMSETVKEERAAMLSPATEPAIIAMAFAGAMIPAPVIATAISDGASDDCINIDSTMPMNTAIDLFAAKSLNAFPVLLSFAFLSPSVSSLMLHRSMPAAPAALMMVMIISVIASSGYQRNGISGIDFRIIKCFLMIS